MVPVVEVRVDGERVTIDAGASILDACDAAGRYVPRLCYHPGFACCRASALAHDPGGWRPPTEGCGLCAVRLADGSEALACATEVSPGAEITTDDPGLRLTRQLRLGLILARHPHICLSCPDGDGCSRDQCTYGHPPQARCCAEFGRCELGKVAAFVDVALDIPRRAVTAPRSAVTEGRIRREPGLCIGCGRCVRVCDYAPEAGRALEMAAPEAGTGDTRAYRAPSEVPVAVVRPKKKTLRASGCTFCGLCVLVCPTGALTAPGSEGARWSEGRRERSGLVSQVLPPEARMPFTGPVVATVPARAGVLRLLDRWGHVLLISGVADLGAAVTDALADPIGEQAIYFQFELDEFYTQRESELLARYAQEQGHLPPGNEVDDDLFGGDLD